MWHNVLVPTGNRKSFQLLLVVLVLKAASPMSNQNPMKGNVPRVSSPPLFYTKEPVLMRMFSANTFVGTMMETFKGSHQLLVTFFRP